ncbi:hypothetical protein AWU65_09705 [Paenibacillus glucanolyticus]|uniref:Uncharacterized protein n=1 Tax=Paenibacillus glucanolyticus TaxID=59843 RepID=A0A163IUY1_9BACL|nr:hypothetical protein [Paenibacillus glucanolyticus]KZS46181.1 hypothetical protein AWU65_09705 [Paenibacillus glucanolyticus]
MSINELRAQYRSSEGRAKQGFVSPIGEVDEEQLKKMVAGSGSGGIVVPLSNNLDCMHTLWTKCACSWKPEEIPFC